MAAAAFARRTVCALRSSPAPGAGGGQLLRPAHHLGLLQVKGRGPLPLTSAGVRGFASQPESAREKAIRLAQQIANSADKSEAGDKMRALSAELVEAMKLTPQELSVEELDKKVEKMSQKLDSLSKELMKLEVSFKYGRTVVMNFLVVYGTLLIAIPGTWYILNCDLDNLKLDMTAKHEKAMASLRKMKGKYKLLKQAVKAAQAACEKAYSGDEGSKAEGASGGFNESFSKTEDDKF